MRLFFYCWLIFSFSFCALRAQDCDATRLIDDQKKQLESFYFLKGYKFVNPKPTNEYSFVFTRGTTYQITLCLEDRKKRDVEMTVFDKSRNLVASNASNRKKEKNILEFKCSATGIYYMQYDFKEEPNFCGASVLAFKRTSN
jgi:hypothetical protein